MLTLLDVILPVFMVIGAGYVLVWRGLMSAGVIDGLLKFTGNFAVPCLLFRAISTLDLDSVFKPELLISFYLGAITCFLLGILGARILFERSATEAVSIGFAALFSNSVLLGLSIMERAYGTASLEPNFAIVAVHAPFCYLVGITAMEFSRAGRRNIQRTMVAVTKAMFSNALAIGLGLGFIVNLTGLPLPGAFTSAVDMISRAALPTALFAVGGVLVRYRISDTIGQVMMICILSLIVHPAIVYSLAVFVFDLPDGFVKAAVVTAAMAPGINSFVFADMYDRAKSTAASTVLVATTLSIFTVSIWLIILGP